MCVCALLTAVSCLPGRVVFGHGQSSSLQRTLSKILFKEQLEVTVTHGALSCKVGPSQL